MRLLDWLVTKITGLEDREFTPPTKLNGVVRSKLKFLNNNLPSSQEMTSEELREASEQSVKDLENLKDLEIKHYYYNNSSCSFYKKFMRNFLNKRH